MRKSQPFTEEHRANLRKAWEHRLPTSEETRKKISESTIGRKPHPHTEETKEKISRANKGKSHVQTEETKEKISKANKGRRLTEEHRKKLIGHIVSEEARAKIRESWKTRLPASEETRNKISKANTGKVRTELTKKRLSAASMGRVVTEETRRKISAANNGRCHPSPSLETRKKMSKAMKGKPRSEEVKKKIREGIEKRFNAGGWPFPQTSLERAFSSLLDDVGTEYTSQYHMGRNWYDFYIPKHNLIIETHGDFWHANPRFWSDLPLYKKQRDNIKVDKVKMERALTRGYRYAIFWEYDVNNAPKSVLQQLKEILEV